jgi:dTDP-glucose pyrophosphorylase
MPTLTIVVPMAGRGSRFSSVGYTLPKPLIPVHGMPMIRTVIETIRPAMSHHFVFVCQRVHLEAYDLYRQLSDWAPGCSVVALDGVTEGAACSALAAETYIDDSPLMIANSDQYISSPIDRYLDTLPARGLDGLVMTMQANDSKWSFAALDKQGLVTRIAEKEPISTHATVGIYNFARGRDFERAARAMIARDARVNGEFYVATVYNELIAEGARIGVYDVGTEGGAMHGLGTPADLQAFLAAPMPVRLDRARHVDGR